MLTAHNREKNILETDVFNDFSLTITTLLMGMRKTDPEISIIIPTYNRNDTLCEAVKSAIHQDTKTNYEILILDNNDDQDDYSTLDMLRSRFNDEDICYYKNKQNLGMTGNWNLAIQLANGKYVVILHDDDKLHKGYIDIMSEIIKHRPNTGIITCFHRQIGDEDLHGSLSTPEINRSDNIIFRDESLFSSYIHHSMHVCGMLFSREKAIEIGGFQDYWYPCADYVFEIRLLSMYGGVVCTHYLTDYRVLENESFKPEVAGRFPIIVYQAQGEINDKYRFLPNRFSQQYRCIYLYKYEAELISQWCRDENEKEALEAEFLKWHNEYGINKAEKWAIPLFMVFQKLVKAYNRFFKINRIRRSS